MSTNPSGRFDRIDNMMPRWQVERREANILRSANAPPRAVPRPQDSPPMTIDRPSNWTVQQKAAFLDLTLEHVDELRNDSNAQARMPLFMNMNDWRTQHAMLATRFLRGIINMINRVEDRYIIITEFDLSCVHLQRYSNQLPSQFVPAFYTRIPSRLPNHTTVLQMYAEYHARLTEQYIDFANGTGIRRGWSADVARRDVFAHPPPPPPAGPPSGSPPRPRCSSTQAGQPSELSEAQLSSGLQNVHLGAGSTQTRTPAHSTTQAAALSSRLTACPAPSSSRTPSSVSLVSHLTSATSSRHNPDEDITSEDERVYEELHGNIKEYTPHVQAEDARHAHQSREDAYYDEIAGRMALRDEE
ncbi:hypothetical protein ACEPAI_6694 [Sanghuangporus weigelae]